MINIECWNNAFNNIEGAKKLIKVLRNIFKESDMQFCSATTKNEIYKRTFCVAAGENTGNGVNLIGITVFDEEVRVRLYDNAHNLITENFIKHSYDRWRLVKYYDINLQKI